MYRERDWLFSLQKTVAKSQYKTLGSCGGNFHDSNVVSVSCHFLGFYLKFHVHKIDKTILMLYGPKSFRLGHKNTDIQKRNMLVGSKVKNAIFSF